MEKLGKDRERLAGHTSYCARKEINFGAITNEENLILGASLGIEWKLIVRSKEIRQNGKIRKYKNHFVPNN